MNKLSQDEVRKQSENALRQWKTTWESHAKLNGEQFRKNGVSINDLKLAGLGKTALVCAYGPSFEENIDLIVKYAKDRDKRGFDILCVDKAYRELVKRGVNPDYVFAADAQINFQDYLEPWLEESKQSTLVCTMTSNPQWLRHWQGKKYTYVNKDNIQSEQMFMQLSGCTDLIPASSNVGNAAIVFAAFILGYDKYMLVGYDYSWADEQSYYAFHEGGLKRYWMNHAFSIDRSGDVVNTSNNLIFSARWLADFVNSMAIASKHKNYMTNAGALANEFKIVDCTGKGLLNIEYEDLEYNLKYMQKRKLTEEEKKGVKLARAKQRIVTHGNPNDMQYLNSKGLISVIINYIDDNTMAEVDAM